MSGTKLEIELLATDFDGTVFRYGNEAPLYAAFGERIQRLRESNGVWVVCTGRTLGRLRKATRGMAREGIAPDFAVVRHFMVFSFASGLAVPMPILSMRILLAQVREARLVEDVVQAMVKALQETDRHIRFSTVTRRYMRAQLPTPEKAVETAEQLRHLALDTSVQVRCGDTDVEARGEPLDKGIALKMLADYLGIGPEKTLAIGDGRTDLPTMKADVAAWTGCPANAKPEVIQRVIQRKGHVARADALAGTIEILDAYASGCVVSETPPGWEPPEMELGIPGAFMYQQSHGTVVKRLEVVMLVSALVVGILVLAAFDFIPYGSVIMRPVGWLLERIARLLLL